MINPTGAPGYRHGDLVTAAGLTFEFGYRDDQWAEIVPPGSQQVGFTVHQDQVDQPLKVGSLFTGYGGLDQAARAVFGGELAWACDNHPSAVTLLQHRHPDVPNLGDITAVDWDQVERVALLCAGFPCTDISNAGERAGIEGAQSGLWSNVVTAIRVLRPRYVLLENVSALLVRGLDRVAADLAALGYDLRWVCLRASDIGAPHRRDRWFGYATPADTNGGGLREQPVAECGRSGEALAIESRAHNTASHTYGTGPQGTEPAWGRDLSARGIAANANLGGLGTIQPDVRTGQPDAHWGAAADTHRGGQQGIQERHGEPHGARQGARGANPDGHLLDWGQFEPAIRRWEALVERPAPEPTELSIAYLKMLRRRLERRDKRPVGMRGSLRPVRVLSPRFVEWLMGLPAGWVTDVPSLSRAQQLRLLGNGVVPQQGEAAIRMLCALTVRPK